MKWLVVLLLACASAPKAVTKMNSSGSYICLPLEDVHGDRGLICTMSTSKCEWVRDGVGRYGHHADISSFGECEGMEVSQ